MSHVWKMVFGFHKFPWYMFIDEGMVLKLKVVLFCV